MLAVFITQVLGFAAHAAENFNPRDDVVAVEPVVEGIFAATEQNGAVAFFRKDAVEIVYPERNTAPGQKRKWNKEAGENRNEKPVPTHIRQRACTTFKNGNLGKITERSITADRKQVQRHKVAQELFALEARFRIFPAKNEEHHIH